MHEDVNESIKQKCLVLISLDRFSDFISDKSNMTNRALAVEVLILTLRRVPNLSSYFYINEILFTLNIKSGWEPKQALIYLMQKLVKEQCIRNPQNLVLITDQQIQQIIVQCNKYLLLHEEITESSCDFFVQVVRYKPQLIDSKQNLKLQ